MWSYSIEGRSGNESVFQKLNELNYYREWLMSLGHVDARAFLEIVDKWIQMVKNTRLYISTLYYEL